MDLRSKHGCNRLLNKLVNITVHWQADMQDGTFSKSIGYMVHSLYFGNQRWSLELGKMSTF